MNMRQTDRILHFCEKLDWNESRLDTKQKIFTNEWTNRCKESDFNFECLSNLAVSFQFFGLSLIKKKNLLPRRFSGHL